MGKVALLSRLGVKATGEDTLRQGAPGWIQARHSRISTPSALKIESFMSRNPVSPEVFPGLGVLEDIGDVDVNLAPSVTA